MRVLLVYLAALVPALAMAVLQPVWSRVDESQHADVLAQYAAGNAPVEGVTTLRPEIVAVDNATGVYRWYPPGAGPRPAETNPQAFTPPPSDASPQARKAWTARHLWGFSYEAMQPPLYYLLAEPAWMMGGRFGGTFGAIYAARLFSALVAAALAPLVYLLALAIRPGGARVALVAAALAAYLPGYVLNATQITNDGLAAVLGAAVALVAVKGARDGWSTSLAAGCGVLLGAAASTKLTAVGLVPLVAAAFLWPGGQPLRRRLVAGAVAAAVAAIVVAPWVLFNLHVYGQPVPARAARDLLGSVFAAPSPKPGYLVASAKNAVSEFVAGEPFGVVPFTAQLLSLSAAWGVLVALGLVLIRRRLRLELLLLLGLGGDFLWVLGTPFLSGIGGAMPGRYLYPAAAAALVLIAVGTEALPRLVGRPLVAVGAGAAVLVLGLMAGGQSGLGVQRDRLPTANAGEPVHEHGQAGGLEVVADRVVVADHGRTVWVHLTMVDQAHDPAEFRPIPDVRTPGGGRLYTDYAGSSAFPETLQPGQSESGWLRLSRGVTGPLSQLQLTYRDVTTDGYSTVETLSVVVDP